tara:strand:+ start:2068 stop:3024 length:957 start_codon:yes stop_codon:yes gene_type:complete
MEKSKKIYVAGHKGMVGSAIVRKLKENGYLNIVSKTSKELDLRNQNNVYNFYKNEKPDIVINAAARVGGILANFQYPFQFIMDNLQIQNNLIDGALKNGVNKFIFLGSSCIYPKFAPQPIKESYLLSDVLEPTNEWYAIAKISGLKLCEAIRKQFGKEYISLMPTNLYGPNDNFDLETSHVLPAMIRKFHEAKENNDPFVNLWGTGTVMREFLHVDDLASAVFYSIENKFPEGMYNIGTGNDISIKDLALTVQKIVNYKGKIFWDKTKPDGTPRKLLDVSKIRKLGWEYNIKLEDGIKNTYSWFLKNISNIKKIKIDR